MRRRVQFLIVGLIFAALAAAAVLALPPILVQDKCLDSGGAWKDGECVL
jgi:hypothetical protein